MLYKNVELYNVYGFAEEEGEQVFSRVPEEVRKTMSPLGQIQAVSACGCEIRFNLLGESAKLTLKGVNAQNPQTRYTAEVYYGGFQGNSISFGTEPTEITLRYPENMQEILDISKDYAMTYDPSLIRVVLPFYAHMMLLEVEGEVTPPKAAQVPSKKWLAYGSSITHGSAAVNPTGTYVLQIDNTQASVNGETVSLDAPACIVKSRTMVPARFIAQSLGAAVAWDDYNYTVNITTQK